MKFEDIIKKISTLAAAVIVYFICAGFYLSTKGFEMSPDGSISLVKEANAKVDIANLAEPIDSNIALSLPTGPVLGSDDAPVAVYEFSSLNCSHCAEFHLSTLPMLKKQFIDSGKIKFIFTNFPLNQSAMKAAMLSECVPESHYSEFLKVLFKKQREWMLSRNSEQVLIRYAMLNGLTEAQAKQCLHNDELAKDILEVRQQGLDRLKIKGTPSFLVVQGNRKEILYGAPDYKTFKAYFENILNR